LPPDSGHGCCLECALSTCAIARTYAAHQKAPSRSSILLHTLFLFCALDAHTSVAYTRLMELQPPQVPFLGLTGPAQPANLPSPPCSQTPRNPSPKSMQDYVLNHHQPLPTVLSGNRPGCSSHHHHLTRIKSHFAVLSRWSTHQGQLGRRRLSPPADRGTDECAKGTARKNLRTPGPVHLRPAA
jgi:hypothetical protein